MWHQYQPLSPSVRFSLFPISLSNKKKPTLVKFTDPKTGLDCDINVNEQLGLRNTGMIKRYCDVVPILRPMVWSLKRWAKGVGMNDPSGQMGAVTFSSYALMLMTISFLQVSDESRSHRAHLQPNFLPRVKAWLLTYKHSIIRKRLAPLHFGHVKNTSTGLSAFLAIRSTI